MCSHKYIYPTGNVSDKKCQAYALINKGSTEQLDIYDGEGKCIFHSQDVDWKIASDFVQHLFLLIEINERKKTVCDLDEVVFVGFEVGVEINYAEKLFYASLRGCQFQAPVLLENKTLEFKKGFPFGLGHSCFYFDLILENCTFKNNCEFTWVNVKSSSFEILNCQFTGCLEFNNSTFEDGSLRIVDSVVEAQTFFHNVCFTEKGIIDIHSDFRDYFIIDGGNYNCSMINFSNSSFRGETVFRNFRFEQQTFFNEIYVENTLLFTGQDENRIFHGYTEFSVKREHIPGKITFQDVNVSHIIEEHRKKFFELEHEDKIVIGRGCIVYRLQTKPIKLDIDRNNQILIEEISRAFTHFFVNHAGHNLGVKILERKENSITLFYFSDENLSEEVFYSYFDESKGLFLSLFGNIKSIFTAQQKSNYFVNGLNGVISLLSICLRTATLITVGQWKEQDTKALLNCIQSDSKQELIDTSALHQALAQMDLPRLIQDVIKDNNLSVINVHQVNQGGKNSVYIERNVGGELPHEP